MSEESNNNLEMLSEDQQLIKNFLDEVERKLPFWMKDDRQNVQDILEELETHIWDRAAEASDDEPSIEDIKQVISQMGSPSKIAGEYKRRGKPKYFITEELWPVFTRVTIVLGAVLLGINFIVMLCRIPSAVHHTITAGELISEWISGSIMSVAIALIVVSIVFIFLSHEGYLPDDFDQIGRKIVISLPHIEFGKSKKDTTTAESETKSYEASEEEYQTIPLEEPIKEAKTAKEPSVKIIRETPIQPTRTERTIINERVIVREPRPRPRPKRTSEHRILGKDYLSEGIIGIVFGVVAIILPFMPFLDFLPYPLKIWIALTGVTGLVLGFIHFFQALVGRRVGLQQGLMFLSLAPKGANIALYYAIIDRHEIAYDWVYGLVQTYISAANYHTTVTVIVWLFIAFTIIGMISTFGRMIRLGIEGFPEK